LNEANYRINKSRRSPDGIIYFEFSLCCVIKGKLAVTLVVIFGNVKARLASPLISVVW